MKEIFKIPSPKKNKIYAYNFSGTLSSTYSKFIYKEKVWVDYEFGIRDREYDSDIEFLSSIVSLMTDKEDVVLLFDSVKEFREEYKKSQMLEELKK